MRNTFLISILCCFISALAKADVKIDAIADDWRSANGVWITITDDGAFILKDVDENILYEGTVKMLSYEYAGLAISTFIVEVDFGERIDESPSSHAKSVIPGAFYAGEGDAARLKLYLLDNDFGWRLNKHFGIETDDSLVLQSRDPQGKWLDNDENEGGPGWWWDCKKGEFIVKGQITYDSDDYFEIDMKTVKGEEGQRLYYLYGNLKVSEVLYINEGSRFIDDYKSIKRNLTEEYKVMIPAIQQYYHGYGGESFSELRPAGWMDDEIEGEDRVFSISHIYMYPTGDLLVESVVPITEEDTCLNLIEKRIK